MWSSTLICIYMVQQVSSNCKLCPSKLAFPDFLSRTKTVRISLASSSPGEAVRVQVAVGNRTHVLSLNSDTYLQVHF